MGADDAVSSLRTGDDKQSGARVLSGASAGICRSHCEYISRFLTHCRAQMQSGDFAEKISTC